MSENIKLQVGVKAFLANSDGKYLVLEHSSLKYPKIKNNWDIPEGRIEPGIPLLENLKREIFEETGLEILGKPKLICAQDIIRINEKHIVRLTFLAGTKGEPQLDEESVSFKWLSLKEMLTLNRTYAKAATIPSRTRSAFCSYQLIPVRNRSNSRRANATDEANM